MRDPDPATGPLPAGQMGRAMRRASEPIEALLADVTAVAIARFRSDGILIEANEGFRQAVKVPAGVVNLSDLVESGQGDELRGALAARRDSRGRRYLEFASGGGGAISMLASWVWDGDELLLLVEPRGTEDAVTQSTLASVSRQLSELRSENERKGRQLERALDDLKGARASIEMLSWRDDVTGLASPRWINELLDVEAARAQRYLQPFSLVMVDIDGLATINNTLGRAAAEQALKLVADALKEAVRTTDVVGRYGEGRFLTMLPICALDQARVVVGRMRAGISRAGLTLSADSLTTSFGLAQWLPGDNAAALVGRVEESLGEAKRAGRDLA